MDQTKYIIPSFISTTVINSSILSTRSSFLSKCPLQHSTFISKLSSNQTKPIQILQYQYEPLRKHLVEMTLGKVVIAGGSGFVGSNLAEKLIAQGSEVIILTRSSMSKIPSGATRRVWAPNKLTAVGNDWIGWEDSLKNADLVVNVCGESIIARWSKPGKRRILQSRLDATESLTSAIASLPPENRPKCYVNASAVGFYGFSNTVQFDENTTTPGNDFLADVCVQWENAAIEGMKDITETRTVILRIGIVMGPNGGAMASMVPAFKLFLGGPLGSGKQWVPWVHVDDLASIMIHAGENEQMKGVYNATSPNPVTMGELSKALGKALNRPSAFPVPGFVVKAGLGEASCLLLDGNRVYPKKLLDLGFEFNFSDINDAMKAISKKV